MDELDNLDALAVSSEVLQIKNFSYIAISRRLINHLCPDIGKRFWWVGPPTHPELSGLKQGKKLINFHRVYNVFFSNF